MIGNLARLNGEHTEGAFRNALLGTKINYLITQINSLKQKIADLQGKGDLDVTAVADAEDLTGVMTLANDIKAKYNLHRADTGMHSNADTTNAVASADATDQSEANTLLNEIKTDINAHRSQATVHLTDDAGNIITSPNASDLDTSIALANEIKADYNAHVEGDVSHLRMGSDDSALYV